MQWKNSLLKIFSFYLVASFFSLEEHGRKFADVMSRTFSQHFSLARATAIPRSACRRIKRISFSRNQSSDKLITFSILERLEARLDPQKDCQLTFERYCIIFLKASLVGLFLGELIFGGTYYWVGLDNKNSLKHKDNSLKQLKTASPNSPWANIWEGLLSEGHFCLRFGGLVFWRGLLSEFCSI